MTHEITPQDSSCPVCHSTDIKMIIEIFQVPIHCNLLWPTQQEAIQAPRGDIQLGFCQDCSHIFNQAFKPELLDYSQAYENSLHFSPRFQNYAEALAARLIERYDLHNKDIIDIGCGQGDFLRLLCEYGGNRGWGFDPSYVPENVDELPDQITFIQDFYSERYAHYKADLICCRHVLEHIQVPRDFLGMIRHSIGTRLKSVVFFEVPNVLFTLRDLGIWDLIYEHCSFFSPHSLAHLFGSCEFNVSHLTETYEGQFLCLEAVPSESSTNLKNIPFQENSQEIVPDVAAFADKYRNKVDIWKHNLERMSQIEQRVVVWGAGSKGATFLNVFNTQDQIEYVIDINSRKHGMYVAGTGQQIVPPEFLRDYQPDVVIVMNPIYKNEIRQLMMNMGLNSELVLA